MQKAAYKLEEVFGLINEGKVVFSSPSRSIRRVIAVYRDTEIPKDEGAARRFIYDGIKALTEKNFCGTHLQWDRVVVDKYGLVFDGKPWFIKFAIIEGELEEISFHPPEQELKTMGGIVISTGRKK